MIRALPCVLDTEDHPRRQRSHHVIHCPSEISQPYRSMCCISTNNAFTVRVSSCPLSLPRIYCSSNDIFSVPKLNLNFLDKRQHFFRFFLDPFPNWYYNMLYFSFTHFCKILGISRFTRFFTPARPADFHLCPALRISTLAQPCRKKGRPAHPWCIPKLMMHAFLKVWCTHP